MTSWDKSETKNETIIFFVIEVKSYISNKNWKILRSQFIINKYLVSLYNSNLLDNEPIPELTITNDNYLNSYTFFLDDYLHKICSKEHIINSEHTFEFFELDHHLEYYEHYLPNCKAHFKVNSNTFPLISDVIYSSEDNILYVSSYKESTSFLSSFFYTYQDPISEISLYLLNKNEKSQIKQKKIYIKQFLSKITKIHLVPINLSHFLFLSFDNGSIQIFQVYDSYSMIDGKNFMEYIGKVQQHNNSIINFGVDKNSGYIYSIASNETSIVVSEFNYQNIITAINIGYIPKTFNFDNENHKLILSDNDGSIFIYQISELTKLTLIQALYNDELNSSLKSLQNIYLENSRNFLFTSCGNSVNFYDFEEKENFQFTITKRLQVNTMDKNSLVTDIKYRYAKGELILTTSNGNIEFWSHHFDYPVLSFRPVETKIWKLIYDKKVNMLITVGYSSIISIFSLPDKWPSEKMRGNNQKNEYSIIENITQNTDNISLLKNAFSRMSFDLGSSERTTIEDGKNLDSFKEVNLESNNMSLNKIFVNNDENPIIPSMEEEHDDSSLDGWEDEEIYNNNN